MLENAKLTSAEDVKAQLAMGEHVKKGQPLARSPHTDELIR